ncbi:MAG TPA: glucosamine-6-phosphate deaminase [Acholeplasmataceae bacterium]|jgi:glucosamine-6-phosphate deaminase|nr:glucosamine-6-phosphate deaminase [Acholeplasmataceae bacterium]
MKVIKVKDYQELSEVASKIFIDLIKEKPDCNLGLATGSSPLGLYEKLIESYKKGEISFKNVKTYNLDEYCELPRNHEQSYFSFMHRNLFDHVDVSPENINIPNSEVEDLEKECERYNNVLNANKIDLQLLGIGANGHIGFNEPGTSFTSQTSIIELAEKTREDNKRFFNSIDEVPKYAITMGIKNILDAKAIVLIANGKNKADAINKLINGEVTEDFPASALKNHPNVTVIIDEEAASLL